MAKIQKKSFAEREELRTILTRYWGYGDFRPLQEEIIHSVLEGNDTLALMPTGGGKSLTFQVPSLQQEGICLVVTPLIALMQDQANQLKKRGIKAAVIHSGMTRAEISITLDNCIFGDYKFLYVSPERLQTELFQTRLKDMQVNLLAVDEAHCISQWGYDFRPSYRQIRKLRDQLDAVPVLALTATATPEVCKDIQEQLGFSRQNLMKMSFDRENLTYLVRLSENKSQELARISDRIPGSGIIYVRNRRKCRELALMLQEKGISADYYHAGLKPGERERKQQEWTGDIFRIMVATNAFGMGIDKPDVRFVIHADLPDSPEAYFQEAGRAGRDGKRAWAILLYSPADKKKAEQRIAVNFPGIPKVREVYLALCNFLQIPHGSGKGHSYDFEFGDFLHRYRFESAVAISALHILAGEGYITMSDAMNHPSRIMFRAGRDELYGFQVRNESFDGFIKLLLRTYSGLFSDYVRIDESVLARRTGLTQKKVVEFLKTLSSRQIIHYIPRKQVPVITFLEERLETKNILISPEKYYFRKERYELRLREMLRYASSTVVCRNQFLLGYFGQLRAPRCGRCDVCQEKKTLKKGSGEFEAVRKRIEKVLANDKMSLERLVESIPEEAHVVIPVIEQLLEEGQLIRGKDLKITLP